MGSKIINIELAFPEHVISNVDLENEFKRWEASKITSKLGINKRHVANDNETALDLAEMASIKVLRNYDKNKIDFVLLCTQSPDYFLPSSACILQDRLGLRTDIGAFDYNLGCSGYIYGLGIAKSLINSNLANSVLLVMSETYTKHIHPKDLANRTIFGDGAAATILETSNIEHLFEFVLGTDGSGFKNLIVPRGAFKNKAEINPKEKSDDSGNIWTENHLYMNGSEIFNFTIEAVPKLVNDVLERNKLKMEDVDYFIFHQANKYMISYLRKKIRIPKERFYEKISDTGNTVSATIPIALKDCINNKLIQKGSKVLLCGFGVGYSMGATIIEF